MKKWKLWKKRGWIRLILICIKISTQKGEQVMAMYDWNHNGKKDMADNFIEYQIYKDVTGQKNEPSYTPSRGNGCLPLGLL